MYIFFICELKVAQYEGIRIPEFRKFLIVESGIEQIFASESGYPGKFLLRNSESWKIFESRIRKFLRLWYPEYSSKNPESASSIDKVFGRNPVPGIRNPWPGIQNPRLSRIPIHGLVKGSSAFCNIFSCYFCITRSFLAVGRTHAIHEPCIWPSSPFVAQWLEHPTGVRKAIGSITGGDSYSFLSHIHDIRALGNSRFQYFSIR